VTKKTTTKPEFYPFSYQDPIIGQLAQLMGGDTVPEASARTGLSTGMFYRWFTAKKKRTRNPHHASVIRVLRAYGWEYSITPAKGNKVVQFRRRA
jgi:hypothetical protein